LIPLTTSLYIPATLTPPKSGNEQTVLVDIGTGFYIEKTTKDAVKFYEGKVSDLGGNMGEIEKAVGGKTETLRGVEDVLRGKVLAQQQAGSKDGAKG
jgi:prefoldin alpha subunit